MRARQSRAKLQNVYITEFQSMRNRSPGFRSNRAYCFRYDPSTPSIYLIILMRKTAVAAEVDVVMSELTSIFEDIDNLAIFVTTSAAAFNNMAAQDCNDDHDDAENGDDDDDDDEDDDDDDDDDDDADDDDDEDEDDDDDDDDDDDEDDDDDVAVAMGVHNRRTLKNHNDKMKGEKYWTHTY